MTKRKETKMKTTAEKMKQNADKELIELVKIFSSRMKDDLVSYKSNYDESDNNVKCTLTIRSMLRPDPIDNDIYLSNMIDKGFTSIKINEPKKLSGGAYDLDISANFGGEPAKKSLTPKEITVRDLLLAVQNTKKFPLGLDTKITLGDFEGNTYHKKCVLMKDKGKVYLAYEMNEYDND